MKTNVLYFGDNLEILRNHDYFPDECVDLIYLDPRRGSNYLWINGELVG